MCGQLKFSFRVPGIYFAKFWSLFELLIWHQMLKNINFYSPMRGKVAPPGLGKGMVN